VRSANAIALPVWLVQKTCSTATNAIIVTVRVKDVEQVFCTSQTGNAIAFADLTAQSPAFVVVTPPEVDTLNPIVGAMIR